MIRIEDHADAAVARLPMQNRTPLMEALVRVVAGRFQGLEDALWSLLTQRFLFFSAGVQLDNLGRLVGSARGDLDDAAYRTRIRAQIRLNRGAGTGDDVLETFRILGPTALAIREFPPAAFELNVSGELPVPLAQAVAVLRAARAGGVGAQLVYQTGASVFTFDTGPGLDSAGWAGVADAG